MKASILITNPFLIPSETKVRLTRKDGFTVEGFFAGYKTYKQNILTHPEYDLFPIFRAANKDGSMGRRFAKGITLGTLDGIELDEFEMEILEYHVRYTHCLKDNKFNDITVGTVAVCTLEMLALAKRFGITDIELDKYDDIEDCHATFDNDGGESRYQQVSALRFNQDEKTVTIFGALGDSGYLDCQYGDYFDVAKSLPHIYKAFMECLKKHFIKE